MEKSEFVPLSDEVMKVDGNSKVNPLFAFLQYLDLPFWEELAHQTNFYSVQTRDHRSVKTNSKEMLHLAGVQILMGTLSIPQAKLYWNKFLGVPLIQSCLTKNRFFELRNHLHFTDNSAERTGNDKLWKIRPFLDRMVTKCQSLGKTTDLSIDVQMIPFSRRFRQYVPSKPNPLGVVNRS